MQTKKMLSVVFATIFSVSAAGVVLSSVTVAAQQPIYPDRGAGTRRAPAAAAHTTPATSTVPPIAIYTDALAPGWNDWSFSADRDFASSKMSHNGTHAIAVNSKAWGCLALASPGVNVKGYTSLSFWINGGETGGQTLTVILNGEAGLPFKYDIPKLQAGWSHVDVKLADLGIKDDLLKVFWLRNSSNSDAPVFYVDDLEIH